MNQMEQEKTIQEQIMDLFATGREVVNYLSEKQLKGQEALLQDMQLVCLSLKQAIETQYTMIDLKNKLPEIAQNTLELVDQILEDLTRGDQSHAEMIFSCSFVPLFLFWERYTRYFLIDGTNAEKRQSLYKRERELQKQSCQTPIEWEERTCRYDLSIVVLFYGNQRMTQECLEAISKYTVGHSYELITFDNGSDEETAKWCENLSHVKKIRYPYNMGSSLAGNLIFSMAGLYAEGKYLIFISNDAIVTPHYDEILYACMESDPHIAFASPVYNSASNFQGIPVPYPINDMDAMWKFAAEYNHCDPKQWVDRARLFPIIGCFRLQVLEQLKTAFDPLFYYDMFADDDFSCNLRRRGCRQVLCQDVFVHHYGSATIGENQLNVMDLGREQFYQKHGVDAWESLGMDLYWSVRELTVSERDELNVLVVNPLFGEGALALRNQLKICGCNQIMMDALTEDPRYLPDIDAMYHNGGELKDQTAILANQRYDIIMVCTELQKCKDLSAVLHIAAQRLKPGGMLITQHSNPFCAEELVRFFVWNNQIDNPYLYDQKANPMGQYLTNEILDSMMRHEGLICLKKLSFIDGTYQQQVDCIFSALSLPDSDAIKERTMISKYFNIWGKNQV